MEPLVSSLHSVRAFPAILCCSCFHCCLIVPPAVHQRLLDQGLEQYILHSPRMPGDLFSMNREGIMGLTGAQKHAVLTSALVMVFSGREPGLCCHCCCRSCAIISSSLTSLRPCCVDSLGIPCAGFAAIYCLGICVGKLWNTGQDATALFVLVTLAVHALLGGDGAVSRRLVRQGAGCHCVVLRLPPPCVSWHRLTVAMIASMCV